MAKNPECEDPPFTACMVISNTLNGPVGKELEGVAVGLHHLFADSDTIP